MFGKGSLAKRLRSGPTLLLAEDPGERLTEAVRRFDPRAEPGDGFVELTFCLLTGPIEVAPELADRARLPSGLPVAYLPEHVEPHDVVNASLLVSGLAHALDGTRHPAGAPTPDDMWIDPVASVFTTGLLPRDDMLKLVSPHLPAAEIAEIPLAEYGIGGDDPISIECGGLMSYEPTMPPPTVRDPGAAFECAIFVTHDALRIDPALLHRAGEVALTIAAGTGGVPLDINGFLLERPEDVHLDL